MLLRLHKRVKPPPRPLRKSVLPLRHKLPKPLQQKKLHALQI